MEKRLGNGAYAYYAYDAAGRMILADCRRPNGETACYFAYNYDNAGRITSIRRDEGMNIYYGYDGTDRLTGETWYNSTGQIYGFAWNYDAAGNRTYESFNGQQTYYEYNAANELIRRNELGIGWSYFDYDERGNCLQKETPGGTQYYAYDSRNLLSFIRYKDATTQYFHHDAQGLMHAMDDYGTLTYFVWDRNGMNLLMERDSEGNVTADYSHGYAAIDGSGSYTGGYLRDGGTTDEQYPFHNHHGDRMVILDQSGAITGKYLWNAWGKTLFAQEPPLRNRFGWQENWIRLKEGHYLSRARVYDEEIGRFGQRDPVLLTVLWDEQFDIPTNRYEYASSCSTVRQDPLGLWEEVVSTRGQSRRQWLAECTDDEKDTVASLADIVGLAEAESQMWLRDEEGAGVSPAGKIIPGKTYSVPNVFLTAEGIRTSLVASIVMQHYALSIAVAAEKLGFKSVYLASDEGHYQFGVENTMKSEDTWGYAFLGHGYRVHRNWYDPRTAPDSLNGGFYWDKSYQGVITPNQLFPSLTNMGRHKFAIGINFHCYANMQPWEKMSNKYFGAKGLVIATRGPRALGHWGSWKSLIMKAYKSE